MRSTDWERRINRSVDTSSTLAPECRTRAEVLTPNLTLGGELAGRDGGVLERHDFVP